METMIVGDYKLWQIHQGNTDYFLLTVMNVVQSLYHDPTIGNYISIVINRLVIFNHQVKELEICVNANLAIRTFCNWQSKNNGSKMKLNMKPSPGDDHGLVNYSSQSSGTSQNYGANSNSYSMSHSTSHSSSHSSSHFSSFSNSHSNSQSQSNPNSNSQNKDRKRERPLPQSILHHDNAILITGVDICANSHSPCGTLGLAPVNGMCQMDRSCSISQDIGIQTAFTVAHEMGHNFGMQHDGYQNNCKGGNGEDLARLMAPQVRIDTDAFAWSTCSKKYITSFLEAEQGSCLENSPKYSRKRDSFPLIMKPLYKRHVNDFPGQKFDKNKQCELQFPEGNGRWSKTCPPKSVRHEEPGSNICKELWCITDGDVCRTINVPAAEGTECALDDDYNAKCGKILRKAKNYTHIELCKINIFLF